MNVVINEVYPSVMAGMVTLNGEIDGREFQADIYPETHKLNSVEIEDVYVYVENVATAFDVDYVPASAEFVFNLQQYVKSNLRTIVARNR